MFTEPPGAADRPVLVGRPRNSANSTAAVDKAVRVFWLLTGLTAVAIGGVGVVLPLLPATPFLLVAAFAFARSSGRLARWLEEHRSFGALINNWHCEGSLDRKTKRTALIVLVLTPIATWLFNVPLWIIGLQIFALSGAGLFILTRPSPSVVQGESI
jgi:uncharacterized membrane protein YbaN (DUF454 family)